MAKSEYAREVDEILRQIRPLLAERGFKIRGRTFNRITGDGLTQVVGFQMGASDPPGTFHIPGLRENLHGFFTVNLGVYVPEVARHGVGRIDATWKQDYDCCVRTRIAGACGEQRDLWWQASAEPSILNDVRRRLSLWGLPFLDRFSTRDRILHEWRDQAESVGLSMRPRDVMAIILAGRGERDRARELLVLEAASARHRARRENVLIQARVLGLGDLDEPPVRPDSTATP